MRPPRPSVTVILAATILVSTVPATLAVEQAIQDAVRTLRRIRPEKMTDKEKEAKVLQIEKAWDVLGKGGDAAAKAMKGELAAVRAGKEKDDFFALSAGALLWMIGGPKEAGEIARVWRETDLMVNYDYVFLTAMRASRSRDPRVLPMLAALLREKRGRFFVVEHVMNLGWPLTQQFVWGTYGSGAVPTLEKILSESKDLNEVQTALFLLARAQDETILPAARKLAAHRDRDVRAVAIQALGLFGHPQDYQALTDGLKSSSAEEAARYADALGYYGDLRAVPLLTPLLQNADRELRGEVLDTLTALLCPESLEAIHRHAESRANPQDKEAFQDAADSLLKKIGKDWKTYAAASAKEKNEWFRAARQKQEQRYVLGPGDRRLDRAEFLKAVEEWKASGRITGGKYDWVEDRHVLAVVTPADIPLLLDLRGRLFERLSDECLDEVTILDRVLQRLGRSRYRHDVGLTSRVEPVGQHGNDSGTGQPR